MNASISLLRGINVGGRKQIRMEYLRSIYEQLGLIRVRTYLQSGNVVFETTQTDRAFLVKEIEAQIEKACGYSVPVFIRDAQELGSILEGNPFINDRKYETTSLHVTFLYQSPSEPALSRLLLPEGIQDEFVAGESAIYLHCPNSYGKTKLSNTFFERNLHTLVTTRNWNTVKALYGMVLE